MNQYKREIALTALAFCLLSLLYRWEGLLALLGGLTHHLVVLLLSIVFAFALALLGIRHEISIILGQHRLTHEKLRMPIALFLRSRLSDLGKVREALTGVDGLQIDRGDLKLVVAACFSSNRGRQYVGTDSNVPTRFYELYPNYLDEQFASGESQRRSHDVRILFASEEELRRDYEKDKVLFQSFRDNHRLYRVRLLQVERAEAEKRAQQLQLPSTDLGVFGGEFVVFFAPCTCGGIEHYRIYLRALTSEGRSQLRQYFRMLNQGARDIRLEHDVVSCVVRKPEDLPQDERLLLWNLGK
jgi:hypothetical protein